MINILFRNPYVLLAGGACLITTTSFWFFERSKTQKTTSAQPEVPKDSGSGSPNNPPSNPPAKTPQPSTPSTTQGKQNTSPTQSQTGGNRGSISRIDVNVGGGSSADPSGIAGQISGNNSRN